MKKFLFLIFFLFWGTLVSAHNENHQLNAQIQKGKELFEKLKSGQITCQNLTDEDFYSIGQYAMEAMIGRSTHLAIEKMEGKEGKQTMYINLGKNFSGCERIQMPLSLIYNKQLPKAGTGEKIKSSIPLIVLFFIFILAIFIFPTLFLGLLGLLIVYLIKKIKTIGKKQIHGENMDGNAV